MSKHKLIKNIIIQFLICLICTAACRADPCSFQYWEVIPHYQKCEAYHLPDFDFRPITTPADASEVSRRFCQYFEISTVSGKQLSVYCYTGEGDRIGPTFRLGEESWNFLSPNKDKVFFADLNFTGCYKDKKSEGIVFGIYGWAKAPGSIERSWPVEKKFAKCKG